MKATYGDLRSGDAILVNGYRLIVRNVQLEARERWIQGTRYEDVRDVVQFDCLANGITGTYRAFAWCEVEIEREGHEACPLCGGIKPSDRSCLCFDNGGQ